MKRLPLFSQPQHILHYLCYVKKNQTFLAREVYFESSSFPTIFQLTVSFVNQSFHYSALVGIYF